MGKYSPAGDTEYIIAKYKPPEPPKPKEQPWPLLILLFSILMSLATEFSSIGLLFSAKDANPSIAEYCYGKLCDKLPPGVVRP